jgi:hypothetical protein
MASIVSVNEEFFYKHFIEESLCLDSDDDSDLMRAVTSVLHKDNVLEESLCLDSDLMRAVTSVLHKHQMLPQ